MSEELNCKQCGHSVNEHRGGLNGRLCLVIKTTNSTCCCELPPAPQGSGEHKLVAENVELRERLATVLARESATAARYDARLAEVEAARDQALTLGAEQVLEIQELRQVVKEYKNGSRVHGSNCTSSLEDDFRCPICIRADILLEPKAKPTQQEK